MRGKADKKIKDSSSKKSEDEPSKSFASLKNIQELDRVLRTSFAAIKNDMLLLQESQHQHSIQVKEARQTILNSKTDFVTIDKFNVMKIKIGELNENMKKIWEIDKKLIEIDAKALPEVEFDKQASEWENEFEKIRQDVKELSSKAVNDEQLNKLVQDINDEFDSIKSHLDDLKRLKDTITSGELEKRTNSIATELEDLRAEFRKIHDMNKDKVETKQVESLISDINSEFDEIKNVLSDVKKDLSASATSAELRRENAKTESKLVEIRKQLSDMTRQQKTFIRKDQVEVLLDDINKEFDGLKTGIADSETRLKKEMKRFASEKDVDRQFKRTDDDISSIHQNLTEETKNLSTLKKRLEKEYFKITQAESLADDINKEFDVMKTRLKSADKNLADLKKASLTKTAAENKFKGLQASLDTQEDNLAAQGSELDEFRKEINKNYLKKAQGEVLVGDINKEFDGLRTYVKSNSNDIDILRKRTKKTLQGFVKKKELRDELEDMRRSLAELQEKVSSDLVPTKKFNKISSYFKKSLHVIESDYVSRDRFHALVDEVDRLKVMIKRKKIKVDQKTERLVATSRKLAKLKSKNDVKLEKVKKSTTFLPYRGSYFIGNVLIIVAFVTLVASIVLFFLNQLAWTDKLAIFSVVAFIIGLMIRIIVIVKRSRLTN